MQYSKFLSYVLCLVSLILILIILLAGANKNVLVDYFFLKANTAALSIPSKLSNSTFLQDLSSLTGNDLVGQSASAGSLGLAESYTVALFTACAGKESCTSPHFGFHFDPSSDLKLENTALQGSFSSGFLHSLSSYSTTSRFLAIGYVLAFVFTFITPVFTLFSGRAPRAGLLGATTSILATVFLLAASSAAVAVFQKVKGTFNTKLEPVGIKTSLGNKLFVISWVATVFSLVTSILLCFHASRKRSSNAVLDVGATDKSGAEIHVGAATVKKPLFGQLMPARNRHKYSQIEEQTALRTAMAGKVYNASDRDVLMTRGFGGGVDEEDEEHELIQGQNRGIQLQDMGGSLSRDMDTAYEPYRNQAGTAM